MRSVILRENNRKLKILPYQSKTTVSQSPPHNRLLKKFENIQKENVNINNDHSFQENLIKNHAVKDDFKIEIEKRFQRSATNKTYLYKRKPSKFLKNPTNHQKSSQSSPSSSSSSSSNNTSIDSMKYVTVYDLHSQNQKPKKGIPKEANGLTTENDINSKQITKSLENSNKKKVKPMDNGLQNGIIDEIVGDSEGSSQLEQEIKDKNSKTYKLLIAILESHPFLRHNIPKDNNFGLMALQKSKGITKHNDDNLLLRADQHKDNLKNGIKFHNNSSIIPGKNPPGMRIDNNMNSNNNGLTGEKQGLRVEYKRKNMMIRPESQSHDKSSNQQSLYKQESQYEFDGNSGNNTIFKSLNSNQINDKGNADSGKDLQEKILKMHNNKILRSHTPILEGRRKIDHQDIIFKSHNNDTYKSANKTLANPLYIRIKKTVITRKKNFHEHLNTETSDDYERPRSNHSVNLTYKQKTRVDSKESTSGGTAGGLGSLGGGTVGLGAGVTGSLSGGTAAAGNGFGGIGANGVYGINGSGVYGINSGGTNGGMSNSSGGGGVGGATTTTGVGINGSSRKPFSKNFYGSPELISSKLMNDHIINGNNNNNGVGNIASNSNTNNLPLAITSNLPIKAGYLQNDSAQRSPQNKSPFTTYDLTRSKINSSNKNSALKLTLAKKQIHRDTLSSSRRKKIEKSELSLTECLVKTTYEDSHDYNSMMNSANRNPNKKSLGRGLSIPFKNKAVDNNTKPRNNKY